MPYDHTQGFKICQNIEIFMPVCNGRLHDLIKQYRPGQQPRPNGPEVVPQAARDMTDKMLSQILNALDFVHKHGS